MAHKFVPSYGAQSFMLSNPPVSCTTQLPGSVEIFDEATMERLRAKSKILTAYLEILIDTQFTPSEVKIITPRSLEERGAQLSLIFGQDVQEVHRMITEEGVICDVRKPNVMRIAPAPMYNSFVDVYEFVKLLKTMLSQHTSGSAQSRL